MTIQRCAHLKIEDEVAPYIAPYGIVMELCGECRAEMEFRLEEKPLSGQTPIEQAAENKTGGGYSMLSTCQQPMKDMRKKDANGKWLWTYVSCGKVCDPGERFCPRHTMLNDLAVKKAADKERAKRLGNAQAVTSARR